MTSLVFTTNTQDGYGAYAIQLRAPMSTSSSSSNSLDIVTPPLTIYGGPFNSTGQNSGGGSGLSSGAAAGIGIAVALAAIGTGVLLFLSCRRRRRARNDRPKLETREEGAVSVDHTSCGSKTVVEMGTKDPDQPEMSGQDARHLATGHHEIDDASGVAELSG